METVSRKSQFKYHLSGRGEKVGTSPCTQYLVSDIIIFTILHSNSRSFDAQHHRRHRISRSEGGGSERGYPLSLHLRIFSLRLLCGCGMGSLSKREEAGEGATALEGVPADTTLCGVGASRR